VLFSILEIAGQKKLEKFAILNRKPRSRARILMYRTCPIINGRKREDPRKEVRQNVSYVITCVVIPISPQSFWSGVVFKSLRTFQIVVVLRQLRVAISWPAEKRKKRTLLFYNNSITVEQFVVFYFVYNSEISENPGGNSFIKVRISAFSSS